MKKFYTMFAMALMGIMLLASCESEDEQIARTLEGNWEGTMSEVYYTRWGDYLEGDRCYTYFNFIRTTATSGYGTEVDEDAYGNSIERDFTWSVDYHYDYDRDRFDIYLRYDSRYYVYDAYRRQEYEYRAGVYDAVIYEAYLSGDTFSGKMEGSDGQLRSFYMRYVGGVHRAAVTRSGSKEKPVIVIDQTQKEASD